MDPEKAAGAEDEPIELTLHICREVKVYRLPPRIQAGGHSSGSWLVSDCIFTGRLRITAKGEAAQIRLEDSSSGELFAMCCFTPATQAVAIEPTVDSSRYYVLRVEDPSTRRHAFLGIGFSDRGAAFDFNAALADHAKQCQRESIVSQAAAAGPAAGTGTGAQPSSSTAGPAGAGSSWQDPALAALYKDLYKDPGDLSLKEGQTIRIDVKRPPSKSGGSGFLARAAGLSGDGAGTTSSRPSSGGGGAAAPVLAPPPVLLPPPAGQSSQHTLASPGGTAVPPAHQPAAATHPAAVPAAPAAVTVASTQDSWATFD